MRLVAFPLSRDGLDAPLSTHFGKARWLAVVDEAGRARFLRNEGLNGRWVARALAAAGATDVVAAHLGGGAFAHLVEAGLRVWSAAPDETAEGQLRRLRDGRLAPLDAPPPHGEGHGGGCGCGEHA
jgi:predicted Fe-Mo cluster-binding NifX family protein